MLQVPSSVVDPEATATLHLGDGRTLAFAEYGLGAGPPILYFHGAPGSRLDLGYLAQAIRETGVRLIAADRPGYGCSDPQPHRSYVGWARDVTTLADHLGLRQFAVEGYSSGGPYAAVCAALLPERVTAAAIVSGVGPPETPRFRQGLGSTERLMIPMSRRAPWLARLLMRAEVSAMRRDTEKFLHSFEKEVRGCASDERLLADLDLRRALVATFLEATRQGVDGWVRDWVLHGQAYGVPLGDVRVPVSVWQGDADRLVGAQHARFLAETIPGAELHMWDGEGHLHARDHWLDVAGWLAARTPASGTARADGTPPPADTTTF